jgi:hypothetical protein
MATSAITDVYVNELLESGKIAEAAYVNGARTITIIETEEFPIADGSANIDIYRFFKGLNPNLIPIDIRIYADDALVGATNVDVGLYKQTIDGVDGVVISVDVFASDLDLVALGAGGLALRGQLIRDGGSVGGGDGAIDGLENVDIANLTKKIYEHAGDTVATYEQGYDLALTVNTDVTTGGTVTIIAQFIEG